MDEQGCALDAGGGNDDKKGNAGGLTPRFPDGNQTMCYGCEGCSSLNYLYVPEASGSYVEILDTPARPLALVGTPFTVEAWFKLDSEAQLVKVFHRGNGNKGWAFGAEGNLIAVATFNTMNHWPVANLAGTGWRHIAWTFDSGVSRIWLDGALLDEKNSGSAVLPTTTSTIVGAATDDNGSIKNWHHGRIDELRVSSVVRFTDTFVPARRHSPDNDTIGLWHFDEGAGGPVVDSSPNGHAGNAHQVQWEPDNCYGTSPDAAICGDGQQAVWEECDDGNTDDGDGCSGTCKIETMVSIPEGAFWMGCNQAVDADCEADESPYHLVDVEGFSIDITQVTVQAYEQCVDSGQCGNPSTPFGSCNWGKDDKKNHPMNCISWQEAKDYCDWADKRLCTEAEWEKAARGGCGLYSGACADAMPKYPWGNAPVSCDYANYYTGTAGCGTSSTWAVGTKPLGAGPYGNLDMVGNLWDWVEDCYHSTYQGGPSDGTAWNNGCENGWSLRGGSFWSYPTSIRSSSRHQGAIGVGGFNVHTAGFRCCKAGTP